MDASDVVIIFLGLILLVLLFLGVLMGATA